MVQPNLTEIVKHIREGTLDFVLLKPIDSQFNISLKIKPIWFFRNNTWNLLIDVLH